MEHGLQISLNKIRIKDSTSIHDKHNTYEATRKYFYLLPSNRLLGRPHVQELKPIPECIINRSFSFEDSQMFNCNTLNCFQ